MDMLAQDLKYVFRTLARNRGFTLAVLLTLGLGIGANTAIFSVVNAVLLQPLPFESPERLVTPNVISSKGFYISTSIPNYYDWRDRSRSFESFGAYRGASAVLTGMDRPEVVGLRQVLGDFFEVLGVEATLGRVITAEETEVGASPIVVVSHAFWQDQLGGDPQVLGRTLILNDEPFEVVGVMPRGFAFPSPDDHLYVPMGYFSEQLSWNTRGSSSGTRAIARLFPAVSLDQAQTDLMRITAAVRETEDEDAAAPELVSLIDRYVGDVRSPLLILMVAVTFVLLIACSNVANLLLARSEGRQREIAVRAALGAQRTRVIRQLLTESLVLGLAGGLLGVGLAYLAVQGMEGILPSAIPSLPASGVSIDLVVLTFTLILSVTAGLIFGFVPAWRHSRPDLLSMLKAGGRSGSAGGRHGMRAALVVTEIALSLVLLAGAGLLIKSLNQLQQVDKGFDDTNVLTMRVPLSRAKYSEEALWRRFNEDLVDRVKSLPGVRFAAVSNIIPLGGSSWETSISPEGVDVFDEDNRHSVLNTVADVDYFDALDIPIIRGRGFSLADDAANPLVVVVDESLAERFWPGENPIGKRVTLEQEPGVSEGEPTPVYRTVVGVAKHVRHYDLQTPSRIEVYRPVRQSERTWGFSPYLIIRTAADPAQLAQAVRREILALDADQPVMSVRTMSEVVNSQLATFSAMRGLLIIFGMLALILAAIGVYGVMSYSVAQRFRELGIRMALGADAGHVQRLVSRQGLGLGLAGLGLGLAGALSVTRLLQRLVFGVGAFEPFMLVAVSGVLVGVTLVAGFVPVRRAARLDPASVLRED